MADGKPDTIDAANEVLVLAFDLADSEIQRLPGQVAAALESPPVQAAIKKTLLDFANTRTKSDSTVVSSDDATKLVAALGAGIKDAATADLLAQVKRTPEFRRLGPASRASGRRRNPRRWESGSTETRKSCTWSARRSWWERPGSSTPPSPAVSS